MVSCFLDLSLKLELKYKHKYTVVSPAVQMHSFASWVFQFWQLYLA